MGQGTGKVSVVFALLYCILRSIQFSSGVSNAGVIGLLCAERVNICTQGLFTAACLKTSVSCTACRQYLALYAASSLRCMRSKQRIIKVKGFR
jgi:hypothetical protein